MDVDDPRAAARDELRQLLDSCVTIPAFLCDRHLTVLASNELARVLSPGFVEGTNLARFAFLESDVDRGHSNWNAASGQVVALLRDSLNEHDADGAFRSIVGELSARSHDFSVAWADLDTAARPRGVLAFDDTSAGTVTLSYQLFRVPDDYEDVLFVWRPVDESSRAALLTLLQSTRVHSPGTPPAPQ